jgi:hypothetical protein
MTERHSPDAMDVDTVVDLVENLGEVSARLTYLSNSIITPFMGCFPVATLDRKSYDAHVDRITDIERHISKVADLAQSDSLVGEPTRDGMQARTRAEMFTEALEEFWAAPLRPGYLDEYMSKPLLLTRLMKLLAHDRTGRYIRSFSEDSRQVKTYRRLEMRIFIYAEALEIDQAAYQAP